MAVSIFAEALSLIAFHGIDILLKLKIVSRYCLHLYIMVTIYVTYTLLAGLFLYGATCSGY